VTVPLKPCIVISEYNRITTQRIISTNTQRAVKPSPCNRQCTHITGSRFIYGVEIASPSGSISIAVIDISELGTGNSST
ncbi:hypothetical protein O6490_24555, partial [Salmonella enterica subsp. enterica]